MATSVNVEDGGRFTEPRSAPSELMKIMDIVNMATQLSLGAVATGAFYVANVIPNNRKFAQHIYLCVFGYVILMSQAVLSISSSGWASNYKPHEKRTVHWVMQVMGSTLAMTGSIIAFTFVDRHFETVHGVLGIIAFIFTLFSFIGGIIHLLAAKNCINFISSVIRIIHSCCGVLTLTIAFLALIFAFHTTYANMINQRNADMYIAFTVIALVGTTLSACMSSVKIIFKM